MNLRRTCRRLTLNRPEKRNALNHPLRGRAVRCAPQGDLDPEVRVKIIRGAGTCFSAGYDLGGGNDGPRAAPLHLRRRGPWPRHVTETWMGIWDLAKPVIAQVHGYCLAGGSELATGCDLVYMAEDAQMGYPAVRFGVPDMHFHAWLLGMRAAMEMMVTGDSISGDEAVRLGWANRAFPAADLDDEVFAVAKRIALIPTDIVQLNKRTVHRRWTRMGMRAAIRPGTELCALGTKAVAFAVFIGSSREKGLTGPAGARRPVRRLPGGFLTPEAKRFFIPGRRTSGRRGRARSCRAAPRGQSEHSLSHDVALDLVAAASDADRGRGQEARCHRPSSGAQPSVSKPAGPWIARASSALALRFQAAISFRTEAPGPGGSPLLAAVRTCIPR